MQYEINDLIKNWYASNLTHNQKRWKWFQRFFSDFSPMLFTSRLSTTRTRNLNALCIFSQTGCESIDLNCFFLPKLFFLRTQHCPFGLPTYVLIHWAMPPLVEITATIVFSKDKTARCAKCCHLTSNLSIYFSALQQTKLRCRYAKWEKHANKSLYSNYGLATKSMEQKSIWLPGCKLENVFKSSREVEMVW